MLEKYKPSAIGDSIDTEIDIKSINRIRELTKSRAMSLRLKLLRTDIQNLRKIYLDLMWGSGPIIDLYNISQVRRAQRLIDLDEVVSILKIETYWLIAKVGTPSEKCRITPGMLNGRQLFNNRKRLEKMGCLEYLHLSFISTSLNFPYDPNKPAYIVDSDFPTPIDAYQK